MKAKYATTCAVCGQSIQPGEEIQSASGGQARTGWAHDACSNGLFAAPPAGASETKSRTSAGSRPGMPGAGRARIVGRAPAARTSRAPRVEQPLPDGATLVYTDGACSGNPGPGGWGWAVTDGRQGSGGELRTTNQRMEIRAAFEAVQSIEDSPLVVVSDSTYVVNCFRDRWWEGWLARDWRNSAKQPVANRDLWEPFVELVRDRGDVSFRWVKGHSGDPMNDLVDQLAVAAGRAVAASGG